MESLAADGVVVVRLACTVGQQQFARRRRGGDVTGQEGGRYYWLRGQSGSVGGSWALNRIPPICSALLPPLGPAALAVTDHGRVYAWGTSHKVCWVTCN